MEQRTWPNRSNRCRFASLPFSKFGDRKEEERTRKHRTENFPIRTLYSRTLYASQIRIRPRSSEVHDFSMLPYDILTKIAASFTLPNLKAASLVCQSWCEALRPLREAMMFLKWGKKFKHGKDGIRPNLEKALYSFMKGVARGSTLAMVDAGLVYWEMGEMEKAIDLYKKAAVLGDSAGQFNLAVSYLEAEPPNAKEAVRWLYPAAEASHVRAQYQLALCLHRGLGLDQDMQEAARWYLKAAEGGYVRAMYNIALCYSSGEGLVPNHRQARKWMKRAADRGHAKAQFEYGVTLFSEGEMVKAVVYLELATRGGERAAVHPKDVIIQQLPEGSRDHAMHLANNWTSAR